jgi:hypothetical protein
MEPRCIVGIPKVGCADGHLDKTKAPGPLWDPGAFVRGMFCCSVLPNGEEGYDPAS